MKRTVEVNRTCCLHSSYTHVTISAQASREKQQPNRPLLNKRFRLQTPSYDGKHLDLNPGRPLTLLRHLHRRSLPLTLLVLLPVRKHIPNPRTISEFVNLLEILLGDLERLGRHVGDVFPDQLTRVDRRAVDLLEQEGAERFDAATEEGAVERDVDAFERDGGEAALELERFGFGLGFFGAAFDDLDKVGFDVFQRHLLHQRLDVDFLGFEVVCDAGEGIKGAELQCRVRSCDRNRTMVAELHHQHKRIACLRRCS